MTDYEDGGSLPYKKKAKKIDKSKCNHIFREVKRYEHRILSNDKVYVQSNIVYRCILCRKRQNEFTIRPQDDQRG